MVRFISLNISVTALLLFSFRTHLTTAASTNTCVVAKDSSDDAITIAKAFEDCKTDGTVVFSKNTTYSLKSVLELSGLQNVNVDLAGTIELPARNTSYSTTSAFIHFEGSNINLYGDGLIIGNGQPWYDALDHTAPPTILVSANDSSFGSFRIVNAPRAHMRIKNSNNILVHNVTFHTASSNICYLPKNTDALQITQSSNIVFKDSYLTVGDDCTAINGGVTNVTVSNIICNGGHGFSVGSLGKGGSTDVVRQVRVRDSTCNGCENGVRIKTWPGGQGSVSDVNYNNIILNNVDNPILVTTHYCNPNVIEYCNSNDTISLTISDVHFKDITGSVSALGNPVVNINCSSLTPCSDFTLSGVDITRVTTTSNNVCENLNGSSDISVCS
ncbi:hypothetical protein G6F49_012434 [Rhizopus delemar]|nr:hypothetical protein G6F49_012434 [Rhizopus delemar]